MRLHANARTTPVTRRELVRMLEGGAGVGLAADALGVSRQTAAKWWRRWCEEGPSGLLDRSSAPRRIPHRTPERRVRRIVSLRRKRLAAHSIARRLKMPRSTVSAVLRRVGLARLRDLEPPVPVVRYERERPGELLHLDTKKLGRIRGIGHRVHGDRSVRARGVGWEFAHVCIDDHSRVAYVEVLDDEKGLTCARFLERAVAWYAEHGVETERILTDNGTGYVSKVFAECCAQLGARHLRTRPYTPRTNGKAERLIQTLMREWAYAKPYSSSARRTSALRPYLDRYNHRRPHGSLGYRPPASRLPHGNNLPGNHS